MEVQAISRNIRISPRKVRIVSCVQRIDLLYERESDERAFFYGSGHFYSSLSYLRLLTISLLDAFLLCLVFTP